MTYDGINPPTNQFLLTASGPITSFGIDMNNELYVVSSDGKIYRFTPTAAIVAPSNLRFSSISPNSVSLNWNDNSNNETGFKIERKEGSGDFVLLESVNSDVTIYTDNSVSENVTYSYRVYAYNSTASSSYSNTASAITVIDNELNSIPGKFQLNQNYPNPFNPSTKITYAITSAINPLLGGARGGSIYVQLKVYDALGKEVTTLVNEEKPAGFYEVIWNSLNSPAGVYFYRLIASNFTKTKSMLLLK